MMNGIKVAHMLTHVANVIEQNKDYLCALDSEVGDGDHGVSMTIGMRTARKALAALMALPAPTPQSAFQAVSDAFADDVGAASGVMYEVGFAAAAAGKAELNAASDWADILEAIAHAIQTIGKAELNDKTMLDAWLPAAQAARAAAHSGQDVPTCLRQATAAAWDGVQRTQDLIPKRGRASRLGERARGYQDAGATSAYLMLKAMHESLSS